MVFSCPHSIQPMCTCQIDQSPQKSTTTQSSGHFKDAIGALNGSNIHATPPTFERAAYCDRKDLVSQNCLFACNFDMNFTYTLTGWEGSATDACVYQAAYARDLHIPQDKYFLADASYPLSCGLLIPYRSVHYHLAKWGHVNVR